MECLDVEEYADVIFLVQSGSSFPSIGDANCQLVRRCAELDGPADDGADRDESGLDEIPVRVQ